MKFAITCLGRSGSKSLAQKLAENYNACAVYHERENEVATSADSFNERSKSVENYGEVNGYLRSVITQLKVDKFAVILRDPVKIFISGLERKKEFDPENLAKSINEGLMDLHYAIKKGAHVIWFDKMTSSSSYREEKIYNWLGLSCPSGFPWIDQTKEFNTAMVLSRFNKCVSQFDWFTQRYFSEYYQKEKRW